MKKNQINVTVFRKNINPKNIYANFFPINAVSGSSFTLMNYINYLDKGSIIFKNIKFTKSELI